MSIPIDMMSILLLQCLFTFIVLHYFDWSFSLEGARIPERPANPIPKREELSVVVVIEEMMVGVVGGAIDHGFENIRDTVDTIMYGHCPEVYKHEKSQVQIFM